MSNRWCLRILLFFLVVSAVVLTVAVPAFATTRVENSSTSANLVWAGNWTTNSSAPSASGGTFSWARTAGASVTIKFTGTYCALIAKKSPIYGKARVYLDSTLVATVDLYSSVEVWKQKVWQTPALTNTYHTVKIQYTGLANAAHQGTYAYINVDAFDITGTLGNNVSPGFTRYQQSDAHLFYTGHWTKATNTSASGGNVHFSNTPGSSVTISFKGTALRWIAKKSPAYGRAKVSLDGGTPVLVELYSSRTAYQQIVWSTGTLASRQHTVTIEWTGTKAPQATSTYINLDAFDVKGTIGFPLGRFEETDAKLAYSSSGAWIADSGSTAASASAGSFRYANSTGSYVVVGFKGRYIEWVAKTSTAYGKAKVTVDGGTPVFADLWSDSTEWQQVVWTSGLLGVGHHRVKIEWTGTRCPEASNRNINIDAFDIVGSLEVPTS